MKHILVRVSRPRTRHLPRHCQQPHSKPLHSWRTWALTMLQPPELCNLRGVTYRWPCHISCSAMQLFLCAIPSHPILVCLGCLLKLVQECYHLVGADLNPTRGRAVTRSPSTHPEHDSCVWVRYQAAALIVSFQQWIPKSSLCELAVLNFSVFGRRNTAWTEQHVSRSLPKLLSTEA